MHWHRALVRLGGATIAVTAAFWIGALYAQDASQPPKIVATVNGEPIAYDSLVAQLVDKQGFAVLQDLITEMLVFQQARAQNITVSDAETDKSLGELKAQLGGDEGYQNFMRTQHRTEANIRHGLVIKLTLTKLLADQLKVSDDQLKQVYDANTAQFFRPARVQLSHILLDTAVNAQQVLAKLRAGENFNTLAKQFSTDKRTADIGGQLGITEIDRLLPSVGGWVRTAAVGATSEVYQTAMGFQIFRLDQRFPERLIPFDEARDQLRRDFIDTQLFPKAVEQWFKDHRTRAQIQILWKPLE